MPEFKNFDVLEMLGVSPISQISDEEIWTRLVTPITKGLLGPIVRSDPPRLLETVAGTFPGDEVSNLNDHRLYGGKEGFVRFPYTYSFYKTENGAFIVKRDLVKFEFMCWFGDVEAGKGELMLKVGLRDRRNDGHVRTNDCSLLEWTYDDPYLCRRLSEELKTCEISIYGFLPGSLISDVTGEPEFESFIGAPFTFLTKPEQFLAYFKRAWNSKRSPGQIGAPVPDVAQLMLPALEALATELGYDIVDMAPSHYHVVKWIQRQGYEISYPEDDAIFNEIQDGLAKIRADGCPLSRTQQSWACVVQNLRPVELIPDDLRKGLPDWPQDNLSQRCLWMHKKLSDKAREVLSK